MDYCFQFSDVVSCIVMLLVLLFIGPMLEPLPVACLSSIIMVNIRTLFHQFFRLPILWKLCKYDFVRIIFIVCKGPSIKDVCIKSRKIDPPCPQMSALAQPPLSVRTHHKFRKSRLSLHQTVRTTASEQTPLPPDCGRLLWTASMMYFTFHLLF